VNTGYWLASGDRAAVQMRSIPVLVLLASLASCSKEPEYSEGQRVCIAQRYTDFDAKKLSQCVDVCKACMNGTIATCNTSCKLKGAS
jgi:hypothetical protein